MTGKVLVVDDVIQNVKLLEAKLASEYYTVYPANSGMECLAKVKDIRPDVILLDVMMPEMDGFEVCRRLKSDPQTAHIPVVMVTALSELSDRVAGLAAGASDFITKPIDEVHLFARVKSLIRLKMMLDELRLRDKTGEEFGIESKMALTPDSPVSGNILVIDDDIVQVKKIQESLQGNGHRVAQMDPEDARDKVAEGNFDLIIISTMLDDLDGLRLGVEIRSQEQTRQVPIMIIVDEDDKKLLFKALEIGIDDYVLSPIEPSELNARVKTQIKRKQYQDMLKSSIQENISAAVVDSLTKLYNRRYLDAHLANMVKESLANQTPLSLMVIDIDHFKHINDKPGWGHPIGDEVLVDVARRITETVRKQNLSTRLGGEEFVVVMPQTDIRRAMEIAERARQVIAGSPFKISVAPGQLEATVSIGVETLKLSGDTPAELLKRADEALYTAKTTGRNRVVQASAMNLNAW